MKEDGDDVVHDVGNVVLEWEVAQNQWEEELPAGRKKEEKERTSST